MFDSVLAAATDVELAAGAAESSVLAAVVGSVSKVVDVAEVVEGLGLGQLVANYR